MNQTVLSQIEDTFNKLSLSDQLRLIERLVHRVHQNTLRQPDEIDNQLVLMAADPEIQQEIQRIEQDF
ncbi:MAG TPA: hypothetical protein VKA70_02555 [Blastocatellia bacterium]|nr:hypothetical protein [Blastocatellia bacterium]